MGGVNLYCGSFAGADKSGSAFEAVFGELAVLSSPDIREVVNQLMSELEVARDYLLIAPDDARLLLPALRKQAEILWVKASAETALAQMVVDEESAGRRLDPSESLGWKLYCIDDLIAACETSAAEGEPIALVW